MTRLTFHFQAISIAILCSAALLDCGAPEPAEPSAAPPAEEAAVLNTTPWTEAIGELASTPATDAPPRLVLLYATCTVNKDFLDPYQPGLNLTPNLDALAQNAAVFTKHRTEAGLSGVAFASIFTGRQAADHGVYVHPTELDDEVYDISEALADGGYEVYYFDAHDVVDSDLNYVQGAESANVVPGRIDTHPREYLAILDRLRADPGYRAAIVTSFTITHSPYDPVGTPQFVELFPEHWSERYPDALSLDDVERYVILYFRNFYQFRYAYEPTVKRLGISEQGEINLARVNELLYRLNIRKLDYLFGEAVARIHERNLLADSLIVFTADHGETLWNEEAPFKWCHGHTLRRDVLDVPLVVYAPRAGVASRRVEFVTRSIDVAPTIAGLLKLDLPEGTGWRGVDLSPQLNGQSAPLDLPAFSHSGILPRDLKGESADKIGLTLASLYPDSDIRLTWAALRSKDLVCKYGNFDATGFVYRLHDLANDPEETVNIFDPGNPKHAALAAEVFAYRERLIAAYDQRYSGKEEAETTEEQKDALEALGYIQ